MKMPPSMDTITIAVSFCVMALLLVFAAIKAVKYRRMVVNLQKELRLQKDDTEKQIAKAREAVRAKSDFLSKMSHEIRTPLNAIIGMARIAFNSPTLSKTKESIAKVEESSRHLLGIINDILDFSKIEAGGLVLDETLFSLTGDMTFVKDMIEPKADEKKIDLSVEIADIEHDGIITDKLRLNQVLINLLSNAVKFTDAGGRVQLSVEELTYVDGESAYCFTVQDNGVGIEPDQARKLFTPFTQANAGIARIYGGTGLGLAISQNIVHMMGGDIELETEPGKGSTFRFTIRVQSCAKALGDEPGETAARELKNMLGKRILIVDDIEINREVVAGLLEGSGAIIEGAANGREALDAFLASEEKWYDLILMDMQMPIMDGCETTRRIRASGRSDAESVRIIAMTANVMSEDVVRAKEAGMDDYIAKPIDVEVLYRVMEEWL